MCIYVFTCDQIRNNVNGVEANVEKNENKDLSF
jgi:hypothetical protein